MRVPILCDTECGEGECDVEVGVCMCREGYTGRDCKRRGGGDTVVRLAMAYA